MAKTSMGLEENVAGLLCYVLTWVTGIIFFVLEKENKVVRFHAMQSIITFGAINVLMMILWFIPIIGWFINILLWILELVLWIMLMIKAYQGQKFKVPWAGNLAEKYAK